MKKEQKKTKQSKLPNPKKKLTQPFLTQQALEKNIFILCCQIPYTHTLIFCTKSCFEEIHGEHSIGTESYSCTVFFISAKKTKTKKMERKWERERERELAMQLIDQLINQKQVMLEDSVLRSSLVIIIKINLTYVHTQQQKTQMLLHRV